MEKRIIFKRKEVIAEANGIIRKLRTENRRMKIEIKEGNKIIKNLVENCDEEVERRIKLRKDGE